MPEWKTFHGAHWLRWDDNVKFDVKELCENV